MNQAMLLMSEKVLSFQYMELEESDDTADFFTIEHWKTGKFDPVEDAIGSTRGVRLKGTSQPVSSYCCRRRCCFTYTNKETKRVNKC